MKHLITLICASVVALGSVASAQFNLTKVTPDEPGQQPAAGTADDGRAAIKQNAKNKVSDFPKPQLGDSIITTAPAGDTIANLARADYNIYYMFGMRSSQRDAATVTLVKGNDGYYYMQKPLLRRYTSAWIKFEMQKDSSLVAHLPQAVGVLNNRDTTNAVLYVSRLTCQQNDDGWSYFPDAKGEGQYNTDIVLKRTAKGGWIESDTSAITISNGNQFPYEMLCMTYADGSFQGEAMGALELWPVTYPSFHPAAGDDVHDYAASFNSLNSSTGDEWAATTLRQAAISADGKRVYLHNPYGSTDTWIMGDVQGDSVTFYSQYLGADYSAGSHMFFIPALYKVNARKGRFTTTYSYAYSPRQKMTMHYDAAKKVITSTDSMAIIINASPRNFSSIGTYVKPKYAYFTEVAVAPDDPIIDTCFYNDEYKNGTISYVIPANDLDGNFINTDKLTYNVFIDADTAYTFTNDNYRFIDNPMTNIPAEFTDDWDFNFIDGERTLTIYAKPNTRIGLQSTYTGGGEVNKSKLVWYYMKGSGIDATAVNKARNAVATEYYDLLGRKTDASAKGIVIKRTVYDDGTTKAEKQLVR